MLRKRRSIRLKDYDYSKQGAYYVTICVNDRKCVFGDVHDGKMILNDAGKMVQQVWDEMPMYYHDMGIDYFQIMPNHVHGIIMLVGAGPCACPDNTKSDHNNNRLHDYRKGQRYDCCEGQRYNYCTGHPQGGAPTAC